MYIALALELNGIIMKPFKFKKTEIPIIGLITVWFMFSCSRANNREVLRFYFLYKFVYL